MSGEFVRTAGPAPLLDLPQLIHNRTERALAAPAFVGPWQAPVSYGALHREVEYAVDALNLLGIGRNDRVAMALSESPETAIATVAIACASTCAPIHPDYAASEFERYFADLKPKALLIAAGSASAAKKMSSRFF